MDSKLVLVLCRHSTGKFQIGFHMKFLIQHHIQVIINYQFGEYVYNNYQAIQAQCFQAKSEIGFQFQYCFTFFSSWLDNYGWLQTRFNYRLVPRNKGLQIQLQIQYQVQYHITDSITDSSLSQRNNGFHIQLQNQLQIQYQVQYQIRFQIQYYCF